MHQWDWRLIWRLKKKVCLRSVCNPQWKMSSNVHKIIDRMMTRASKDTKDSSVYWSWIMIILFRWYLNCCYGITVHSSRVRVTSKLPMMIMSSQIGCCLFLFHYIRSNINDWRFASSHNWSYSTFNFSLIIFSLEEILPQTLNLFSKICGD